MDLSHLKPHWMKSPTAVAKQDYDYRVTNADLFNNAIFGMNSPKVKNGDILLCLGKGPGKHPKFMIGITGNGRDRPTEHVTTSYKADGRPDSFGLELHG